MTLPTGAISFGNINSELGRTVNQALSLNDSAVRNLSGQTSGAIDMNSLRGKSASVVISWKNGRNNATGTVVNGGTYTGDADFSYFITTSASSTWTITRDSSFGSPVSQTFTGQQQNFTVTGTATQARAATWRVTIAGVSFTVKASGSATGTN